MTVNTLFDVSYFFLVFFVSLSLSMILVPLSRQLAFALGAVDRPDARKVHSLPLPRLGGVGIAGALLFALLLCVKLTPLVTAFLLGGVVVILTGLLDDVYSLPPKVKFVGQIVSALVFIYFGGGVLPGLGDLFGQGVIGLGPFAAVFTVFAMVGVMNALNLSDGLDGLAGGMSAICFVYLGVIAYTHQAWFVLVIILAAFGAILGFLRHNTHPAKLFMGDTGSLFLGYTLAALTVALVQGEGFPAIAPIVPVLVLSLPVSDTLWVMGRRLWQRENPFRPDKTHSHHRLIALGLHHGEAVSIVYGLMFLWGGLALLCLHFPEWQLLLIYLGGNVFLYGGLGWCERKRVNLRRVLLLKVMGTKRSPWRRFMRTTGKYNRVILRVVAMLFLVPVIPLCPPPRIIGYFSLAALLFVVLLYPWRGGRREMPMAHGLFFVATFFMTSLYWLHPQRPSWLTLYLVVLGVVAFLWSVPVLFSAQRHKRLLLPTSFELILIVVVWFVPLVLAPTLELSAAKQLSLVWACLQAVPILILFKFTARRHARRNRWLALSYSAAFLVLGVSSFL